MTTRSKDNTVVLSYDCDNIPDLDISLLGSYADGCVPRYEIQQASLILIFDTESCRNNEETPWVPIILIGVIIFVCIVIAVVLVTVFTNKDLKRRIFSNRTKDTAPNVAMSTINKMELVDTQIESTTARVDNLNKILDG